MQPYKEWSAYSQPLSAKNVLPVETKSISAQSIIMHERKIFQNPAKARRDSSFIVGNNMHQQNYM